MKLTDEVSDFFNGKSSKNISFSKQKEKTKTHFGTEVIISRDTFLRSFHSVLWPLEIIEERGF